MSVDSRDQNLLFAILALQNNFIDQNQLLTAFREFTLQPAAGRNGANGSISMQSILLESGAIDHATSDALETLVAAHLARHGFDSKASLHAIEGLAYSLHQSLNDIDPEVESSLAPVPDSMQKTISPTLSASLGRTSTNGRFQILRPYAKGGLGEVFVARDEELDREVALKQIRGDDQGCEKRERFVREAEITGKLEHPGIIPVYGLGTDKAGKPYYAMRFIRGQSLRDAIKKFHQVNANRRRCESTRNMEFRKLLGWFVDVCNAISYAHSRGVIHRDLKPSNIMIGRFGETLVVDWGLARVSGVDDPLDSVADEKPLTSTLSGFSSNTMDGQAIGTPAYMSPEQATGRLDRLGPHTDVYGLGATLYALLAGKAPHQGSTDSVLKRVASGEFRPPTEVNPEVPRPLEAICLKAMAMEPRDRYATPTELAQDVESWLADELVGAWDEPLSYRVGRWIKRNHTAVFGGTMAAVALAGAMTIASFLLTAKNSQLQQASNTIEQKNLALQESNEKETAARTRADRVTEYLVQTFKRTDPRQDGRALTLAALLDASRENIKEDLDGDPLTQADLYSAIGQSYRGLGLYEEARETFARELELRTINEPETSHDRWNASYRLAEAIWRTSEYDEAIDQLLVTIENQEAMFGRQDPHTLTSLNLLAICYQAQGNWTEARDLMQEILTVRTQTQGPEHPDTLMAMNNLASAFDRATEFKKAHELYETALEMRLATAGPDHPDTVLAKQSLAMNLRALGEFDEAISLMREVVEYRKVKFGESHPETLTSINSLVLALQDAGEYSEIVDLIQIVRREYQDQFGDDHQSTMRATNTLGMTYVRTGQHLKAIPVFRQLLPQYESKFGPENPSTMSVVNNLAMSMMFAGKYEESIPYFERAYQGRMELLGAEHSKTILSYNNMALAIEGSGDYSSSLPILESSLKMWRDKEGPDHPNTLSSARMLGTGLRKAGLSERSEELLRQTLEKQREVLALDHPHTLYSTASLAETLIALDQPGEAREIIQPCLQTMTEKFGERHPQTLAAHRTLARIEIEQGQFEAAEKRLRRILEVAREDLGPEHPSVMSTMGRLALALAGSGQTAEAREYFEQTVSLLSSQLGDRHPDAIELRLRFAEFLLELEDFATCESVLNSTWKNLPSRVERNLLPVEKASRDKTVELHVSLYQANGDEDQQKIWESKRE